MMTYLSNLLQFTIVDPKGNTTQISDLAMDIKVDPYPPVTHILWQKSVRELFCLHWQAVVEIDQKKRQIRVDDLQTSAAVDQAWLKEATFLKRDILDGLMLNLSDRTAILANDLWLERDGDQLQLCAVDIGFWAIIRRLSQGRIAGDSHLKLRDWKYIEFLRGTPDAERSRRNYHGLIDRLPSGEIAYLADLLPYPYAAELLTLLSDLKAADTLEAMRPELQMEVFEEWDPQHATNVLTLMRPDIAADLLGRMVPEEAQGWLEKIAREQSDRIVKLMAYPADTAGGIMSDDIMAFPEDITIGEAISRLRRELHSQDPVSFVQIIYIVDNETDRRLQGALSMRDLLIAEDDLRLEAVMNPYLITIHSTEKAKDASRRVVESELAALPVVDEDGQVLGAITIDTALAMTMPKKSRTEVLRLFS